MGGHKKKIPTSGEEFRAIKHKYSSKVLEKIK